MANAVRRAGLFCTLLLFQCGGTVGPGPNPPPANLTYSENPAVYHRDVTITPNSPMTTGGTPVSYAVSPELPAGLILDPSTGIITGTPGAVSAKADYRVTASNEYGSATMALSITVDLLPPTLFHYRYNPVVYVRNRAILPNAPSLTGSDLTFTISPTLPVGLSMASATGVITGTPTELSAAANYTLTAANPAGSRSITLNLRVADAAPLWGTNGTIQSLVTDGSKLYLGGSFNQVGPYTGSGLMLDRVTGGAGGTWWPVNGNVLVAVKDPDTDGGYYIGGTFTKIGTMTRNRIARIKPNGDVDESWNPNCDPYATDSWVYAITVLGSTVYAGGYFSSIGGQSRSSIAALDKTTGAALLSWNPGVVHTPSQGVVYGLSAAGGILHVGGNFGTIGGQPRNYIAALDAATGTVLPWNPNANNIVYTLVSEGSVVYAGGSFSSIGGEVRSRLAALDGTSGLASAWNPNLAGVGQPFARALLLSGGTLYVAGWFSTVGTETRRHLAAIRTSDGLPTAWDPNLNERGDAIALSGSTLFVAGLFTTVGSETRKYLAAIDTTTGLANGWNPGVNGRAGAVAISASTVYAGGYFSGIGGVLRSGLAALDIATGEATSWDPNVDGAVHTLLRSGNVLYAGGGFTKIGAIARGRLAAFDLSTGSLSNWNPSAGGIVRALATNTNGSVVYAGGDFTTVGGMTRNRLAGIDLATGGVTAWDPNVNGNVHALLAQGNTVAAGGAFTKVNNGTLSRNRLASFDDAGSATTWDPNALDTVHSLALQGTTLFAGGAFKKMGGQTRVGLASFDLFAGGELTSWAPELWNNDGMPAVYALKTNDSMLYLGGTFGSVAGVSRRNAAAIHLPGGTVSPWNPNASDGPVYALEIGGSSVYLGGGFLTVGGRGFGHLLGVDPTTGVPQ